MKNLFLVFAVLTLFCCKQKNSEFENIITNSNSKWVKSSFGLKKSKFTVYTKFLPNKTYQNFYLSNDVPVRKSMGQWTYNEKNKLLKVNEDTTYQIISFTKDSISLKENNFLLKLYNFRE